MMSAALAPSSLMGASISSSKVARFEAAAPVKMTPRRNVAVRASASDNAQPRRAFLATLAALSLGAGAALADQGRKEVRDKANDLLRAADDLTNNDSPPRYGGNRGEDPAQSDRGAARGGGDAKEQAKAGLNSKSFFSLEKSSKDIYGRARKQIEKALS
jgi:uncharacterized protein HemX